MTTAYANNFRYNAVVTRDYDGDSLWVRADLGLRIHAEIEVRVFGINAPELRTPDGAAAAAFAAQLLPVGTNVVVHTHAPGTNDGFEKYGRWLGDITLPDGSDFGQTMISSGHAVAYFGIGPKG